jgi:hypothetical protein
MVDKRIQTTVPTTACDELQNHEVTSLCLPELVNLREIGLMAAKKTRLLVRPALFKHNTGGLVVKWVNISESLLLYIFDIFGAV